MDTTTVAPIASIGVDIGKEVFHLVGFGTDGKIAFRRKIKRLALIETFKKLTPCVVGMEACLSAVALESLRQRRAAPAALSIATVQPFSSGIRRRLRDADPTFRRTWLHMFVSKVTIGTDCIRICGPKHQLL
jgi:transposase